MGEEIKDAKIKKDTKQKLDKLKEKVAGKIKEAKEAAGEINLSKVPWYRSISARIMLLVFAVVLVTVLVITISVTNNVKSSFMETLNGSLLFTAECERDYADAVIGPLEVPVNKYVMILAEVKVNVYDTSYCFVVDPSGNVMYHPLRTVQGTTPDIPLIKEAIAAASADVEEATGQGSYTFNGVKKLAAYAETENGNIIFATVDESEGTQTLNDIINICTIIGVLMIVIALLGAFVLTRLISRPIQTLTGVIKDTAEFNFKKNDNTVKLSKRGDETGMMARAVHAMRDNLRGMITDIEASSDKITENINTLKEMTLEVNEMCADNSATSGQIADGMEEAAATTDTIYTNIGNMQSDAMNIIGLSEAGDSLSGEVRDRADVLKSKTREATQKTRDTYEDVKVRSARAIEESKAVEKINELTDAIMRISSQTSLLALNASIEAARAGDAGRGFAVVASEIGTLASQTSTTVANINTIVSEVNGAVNNMSSCLEDTSEFLEKTVLTDYADFENVSEQYSADAEKFKESMNEVKAAITTLTESITNISEALSGISTTVGESTVGVNQIADKANNMASSTGRTNELVEESLACITQLKNIVDAFTLE